MKKSAVAANIKRVLANITLSVLYGVLFICANTTSCTMIHQPQSPEGLDSFRKMK